jgi:hypothetical protein
MRLYSPYSAGSRRRLSNEISFRNEYTFPAGLADSQPLGANPL